MPSVEKAARFLAQWKACLGSELWARSQDTEIAAGMEQLGGSGRILVVVAASETIPAALESLADMTLDLTLIASNGKS